MFEYFALTDTGRMRENNEDSVRFDATHGLCVLADGMGGYNAGEVASDMATALITSELGGWLGKAPAQATAREVRRAMEVSVENANASIYEAADANPHYAGMGTTLVVAVFLHDRLILGHIGDSRCYRWRRGALTQITHDHSLLQEQLDAGLITPEQAAGSANRNLVTRAVGIESAITLEVNEYPVEPGDLYLMCSDGLTDMVGDADIAAVLSGNVALEVLATRLVERANACGGRDNISVLLVNASQSTKKRGIVARLLEK
jgi:protein phosphatase